MRWRRPRTHESSARPRQPLVVTVTEPVTRATAAALVARVSRIAAGNPVVIDLTAIPEFDTDGAAALIGLQESFEPNWVSVIGFRQATARLIGTDDIGVVHHEPDAQVSSGWVVRRLRAITVVQAVDGSVAAPEGLDPALSHALDSGVGIVVVDLRGVGMTHAALDAIAFASSTAALNGQELLVVNADVATADQLRRAGLSSTTYVAPEPLSDM